MRTAIVVVCMLPLMGCAWLVDNVVENIDTCPSDKVRVCRSDPKDLTKKNCTCEAKQKKDEPPPPRVPTQPLPQEAPSDTADDPPPPDAGSTPSPQAL